jgi:hypothetical protein
MSQVLHEKPDTSSRSGAVATGSGRPRRGLAAAVVALGLLLGATAGWGATTMLGQDHDASRSNAAQTARLQGAADRFAEQQQDELRRREAERQRWEAQADHFDPGWRER